MRTVAVRGSDGVSCEFGSDEKACITVIAGITKSGRKLPLWVCEKGTTDRCTRKFLENPVLARAKAHGWIHLTHSENGWCDEAVAKAYLKWLAEWNGGGRKYVIWDLFAAHRCDAVKAFADEEGITLEFIPAGQTGSWQPLDNRIFGVIKAKAKEMFDGEMFRRMAQICNGT